MYQPGQKVVCVDDSFHPQLAKHYTALPKKDETYVVRGVAPGVAPDNVTPDIAVYLVGLQNPCSSQPPYRERGFKPERFVPLDPVPPMDEEKDELAKIGQFVEA